MALRIVDDALAPKGAVVYEYYGPNPFSIYFGLSGILQSIFHVRGKDIFEDQFRWDTTGDPRQFFLRFHMNKGMDKFTEGNVNIKVYGMQPINSESKEGKLLIEISGDLETSFFSKDAPMTALQKIILEPFVWIYCHLWYYKIRRQYLHFLQDGVEQLEAEFRKKLGLEMHERLTPRKTEFV